MAFNKNQPAFIGLRNVVAERTHRIVVWCGAGLSVPAGLPTWGGLRGKLHASLEQKALTFDQAGRDSLLQAAARIKQEYNFWVAFQMLEKSLGQTTFRTTIKESLRASPSAQVPEAYRKLWRLRISGLLNLNLDRLATRAFVDVHRDKDTIEFNSKQVASYLHVLKSPDPFIYNLHGVVDDATSWVLTHEQLKALLEDESYTTFVRSVVTGATILFVGVSAEDVAVGGHLEWLVKHTMDIGSHYWITDRRDKETDRWAEDTSIQVVRYNNGDGTHAELLELLDDLASYVPQEDSNDLRPVILRQALPASPDVIPTPEELVRDDAEQVRLVLNRHASELLADETDAAFAEYERFSAEYDEAIHRAWYISTVPGRNTLLGYQVQSHVARGAFGRVYKAINPDGDLVAIKVLLNEVRTNPEMLKSFRRGVRSMRILSERQVQGMVPYRDASEIPAFAVMDWVEGANLRDAVHAGRVSSWDSILRVATQLTEVILNAHALPERVLHRDLRPANVMLQDLWTSEDWKVVVLDFDLSWHRGAYEHTVVQANGVVGYLAPEQIERIRGVSTRHGAVDSFGVGMTLYFVLTRADPIPDQHRHPDWEERISNAVRNHECRVWRSLPARFARTLLYATRDRQADRWDMGQLSSEFQRLQEALDTPSMVAAAELIAEELAARSEILADYRWDSNKYRAYSSQATGVAVEIDADESRREVRLSIGWATVGHHDRRNLVKMIQDNTSKAAGFLSAAGWKEVNARPDRGSLQITASLSVEVARVSLDTAARGIDRAARVLRFD